MFKCRNSRKKRKTSDNAKRLEKVRNFEQNENLVIQLNAKMEERNSFLHLCESKQRKKLSLNNAN